MSKVQKSEKKIFELLSEPQVCKTEINDLITYVNLYDIEAIKSTIDLDEDLSDIIDFRFVR